MKPLFKFNSLGAPLDAAVAVAAAEQDKRTRQALDDQAALDRIVALTAERYGNVAFLRAVGEHAAEVVQGMEVAPGIYAHAHPFAPISWPEHDCLLASDHAIEVRVGQIGQILRAPRSEGCLSAIHAARKLVATRPIAEPITWANNRKTCAEAVHLVEGMRLLYERFPLPLLKFEQDVGGLLIRALGIHPETAAGLIGIERPSASTYVHGELLGQSPLAVLQRLAEIHLLRWVSTRQWPREIDPASLPGRLDKTTGVEARAFATLGYTYTNNVARTAKAYRRVRAPFSPVPAQKSLTARITEAVLGDATEEA